MSGILPIDTTRVIFCWNLPKTSSITAMVVGKGFDWDTMNRLHEKGLIMKNHEGQDLKYQLFGWILFIVCAIFFIASSLKNGDILTFIGSVIFLIACVVFLIPLFRTIKKAENDTKKDD